MSHVRIEEPRPHTSASVMDRPDRMNSMAFGLADRVDRWSTQGFEEATNARRAGRKPAFED